MSPARWSLLGRHRILLYYAGISRYAYCTGTWILIPVYSCAVVTLCTNPYHGMAPTVAISLLVNGPLVAAGIPCWPSVACYICHRMPAGVVWSYCWRLVGRWWHFVAALLAWRLRLSPRLRGIGRRCAPNAGYGWLQCGQSVVVATRQCPHRDQLYYGAAVCWWSALIVDLPRPRGHPVRHSAI